MQIGDRVYFALHKHSKRKTYGTICKIEHKARGINYHIKFDGIDELLDYANFFGQPPTIHPVKKPKPRWRV